MNRLIIVGNGFDLAHGLKTSYCDFITDYMTKVLNAFSKEDYYDDPLISISYNADQQRSYYPIDLTASEAGIFGAFEVLSSNPLFKIVYKSELLERTIKATKDIQWVDLENEYFDELIKCRFSQSKVFNDQKVRKVNEQFQYMKERLEEYLLEIQFDDKAFVKDPEIERIFKSQIQSEDLLLDKVGGGKAPREKMFLNFNYTNTLSKYLSASVHYSAIAQATSQKKDLMNYIHGKLGDKANPLIFGFGDEYDSNYLEFELSKNNDLFRHIKSFAYLKTRNYHDLIRFLMLDKFQVFIVGHSCGLSDRTMFKEIFGHENCRSIKIFYYQKPDGSNDFTEKTYNIARHFTQKGEMRKKIVPEPLSSPLPQFNPKYLTKTKK